MPTDYTKAAPVALFLFAHQDDEYGVFEQILMEQKRGHRVLCAYLTSGVANGQDPERRNQESISVLTSLGVHREDIFFAGQYVSIDDGRLPELLQTASEWLGHWIDGFPSLVSVYVMAWEGGHPDHDALHAMTVQIFSERGLDDQVRQFPLYNSYNCSGLFYRVLFPLSSNGPVEYTKIPWSRRRQFLGYCLRYPSQLKSWIGLFPFVLLHYVFRGNQALQPVSISRTQKRPHDGSLYYEKRGFSSWHLFEFRLSQWKATRTLKR